MILPFPVLAQSGLLDLVDQHFERGCQFCVACPNDGINRRAFSAPVLARIGSAGMVATVQ